MIIGNPIMAGASGPAASIFVTGLSETDTVTATNGSKTKTGVWTQKSNPAYVVPEGYTQLKSIKSTDAQYFDTGVVETEKIRFEVEFTSYDKVANPGFGTVFGVRSSTVYENAYDYVLNTYPNKAGGAFQAAKADVSTVLDPKITPGQKSKISFLGSEFIAADGSVATYNPSAFSSAYSIYVFAKNNAGTANEFGEVEIEVLKFYSGSTLIRNYIPAKRDSDGAVGFYDIVNNTFGGSATSTPFIAGEEIPQTFDGFLIKPIREFGTWTVTATDGTNTATQDVLVDVITEYEIEMTYKLWLYKNGDECTDVTGGWSVIKSSTGTMSKQDDGIQINVGPGDETYCNIGIANTIDVTEYSKLTMRTSEVTYLHCSASVGLTLCTGTTPVKTTAYYTRPSASTSTLTISPDDLVVEDISSMTGSYNVVLVCGTGGAYSDSKINYKVYEVWLE